MRYVLVALVVLAGCAQSVSPSPGSSAVSGSSPVVSAGPGADLTCVPMGGTPRPCSPEEFRETEEQNRLTEEAIGLYRRWIKESTRLYRAGGTNKPTKEMLEIMAGEALDSGLAIFRDLKSARAKAVSGALTVVRVGPDVKSGVGAEAVAIVSCVDGRSLRFKRGEEDVSRGPVFSEHVVARPVDGRLLLWSASSELEESCS